MKRMNVVKGRTPLHGVFMPIGAWYGRYVTSRGYKIDYYIYNHDSDTIIVWSPYRVVSRRVVWDGSHNAHTRTYYNKAWHWEARCLDDMPRDFREFIHGLRARLHPHGKCSPWIERSGRRADTPRERRLNIFDKVNTPQYVGR